ncbi:MAG: rhombosortase [Pseudomonadota bacterium]
MSRGWPLPASLFWTLLGITALVLLLQALPPDVQHLLRYERAALLQGQWWRALTGHVLHLSWTHALLNLAGLWLCCGLAGAGQSSRGLSGPGLMASLAGLGLGVSALLCVLSPSVAHYVGLSGILYGLLVGLMGPQGLNGDRTALAITLAMMAWAAWQAVTGAPPREEALIGGAIITQAHLYGIVTAATLWACGQLLRRATRR